MVIVICILLVLALIVMYFAYSGAADRLAELEKNSRERETIHQAVEDSYVAILQDLANVQATLRKTISQKKSSEVKTGLIVEQMAPFLEGFPYDPSKSNFLARPLDFVVFDDEGIHFVEVKSGNAQLSGKQRKIRDQINNNRVTFEVYRIKGE